MSITIMAASVLLLSQAAPAIVTGPETTTESRDAAYEQLAGGENEQAAQDLERLLAENPNDPALLINLGAAYTRLGRFELATDYYRQAIATRERYELELADGSWLDSRKAARQALADLEGRMLAMR